MFFSHLIVLAMIVAAIVAERKIRDWHENERHKRRMLGHLICRGCGYDVHATTGRCPECGFPIAAPPVKTGPPRGRV